LDVESDSDVKVEANPVVNEIVQSEKLNICPWTILHNSQTDNLRRKMQSFNSTFRGNS